MSTNINNSNIDMELLQGNGIGNSVKSTVNKVTLSGIAKGIIDFMGALVGLILLIPVFILIILLMKMNERNGTIFFKQTRIGRNMISFEIIKFRSMIMNAEEKLRSDPELYKKYVENNYKIEQHDDPRITRLGRILRKTSLDELPQLINVLRGEMSLVGPRPIVWDELKEYGDKIMDFLSVKPGLTGYWQISGRSSVGYPERAQLELYYTHNQSIWLDIKIMFLTVWYVLSKKGAY